MDSLVLYKIWSLMLILVTMHIVEVEFYRVEGIVRSKGNSAAKIW